MLGLRGGGGHPTLNDKHVLLEDLWVLETEKCVVYGGKVLNKQPVRGYYGVSPDFIMYIMQTLL